MLACRQAFPLVLALPLALACGEKDGEPRTDSGLYGSDGADGTGGGDGADGTGGGDGADGSSGPPSDWDTCSAADGHSTDLDGASIDGDVLTVDVAYSGGCEEHVFTLCWDQSFAESAPVQVQLDLLHTGIPDPCEAYPAETLLFDLSPLKEAYATAYGSGSGNITVNLATRGGSATITYSF